MNLPKLGTSVSPYRAHLRPQAAATLERSYVSEVAQRISHDLSHLSLESRVDLSQKAQAAPPPPPSETRRRPQAQVPKCKSVHTTDFTGRQCSGTLHGPLLMEDAPLSTLSPKDSHSLDLVFEHEGDRQLLRSAGLMLGALGSETLQAPATGEALVSLPALDSSYSYMGVRDGVAQLVQTFQDPLEARSDSVARLADGSEVKFCRGQEGQLSIFLPAQSLDQLIHWGRNLLAVA